MSNSTPAISAFRTIFRNACIFYTVIILFFCFVLTGLSDDTTSAVAPLNFLLVFPFSLCFAVANYIHRNVKIGGFWKFILHFLLTVGSFYCCLYLPYSGSEESTSFSFIIWVVFSVCYLIVYSLVLLFRKRWKKEFGAHSEYTPKFASKDSERTISKR